MMNGYYKMPVESQYENVDKKSISGRKKINLKYVLKNIQ